MIKSVRPPAVAGNFYPDDEAELKQQVESYLQASQPANRLEAKAYIVPHAGYIYSGQVAATAYAQLIERQLAIKRVVLLGPCHRVWLQGLAVPSSTHFATPLGEIPLDTESIKQIGKFDQVVVSDQAHREEHSLEVQLPFVQLSLGEVQLIPIAVGEASTEQVAQVLDELWGEEETLILISSDLSHFHDYQTAKNIDQQTSRLIEHFDYHKLEHEMACGATPIKGLLKLAKEKSMLLKILAQCNSGDTAGDKYRVVGYASYAIY